MKKLLVFIQAALVTAESFKCAAIIKHNVPLSIDDGNLVSVKLVNDLLKDVDICMFNDKGFEKIRNIMPRIQFEWPCKLKGSTVGKIVTTDNQNSQLAKSTCNFWVKQCKGACETTAFSSVSKTPVFDLDFKTGRAFNIRESIPGLFCKGKIVAGPLRFTADDGYFSLFNHQSRCTLPPLFTFPTSICRGNCPKVNLGWSKPMDFSATIKPGEKPLEVTWEQVLTARSKLIENPSLGKYFGNKSGSKWVFPVHAGSEKLIETPIYDDGVKTITRLIVKKTKDGLKYIGVVTHTEGLSNGFKIMKSVARGAVAAALEAMTPAGLAQAASEAVATAVQITRDVETVVQTVRTSAIIAEVTEAAAAAGISVDVGALALEFLQVVAFILL